MYRFEDAVAPRGVDNAKVDGTIASGFPLLRFPCDLEAAFEGETGRLRCRQLLVGAIIGVFLYNCFLLADFLVTPDIFVSALWVRLGITTPIGLAVIFWLRLYPGALVRESLIVASVWVGLSTHLYLMLISHSPHRDILHQAVIRVVLWFTAMHRLRFWHSIFACLACFAFDAGALASLPDYPLNLQIFEAMLQGCVVIFALLASYRFEHEARLNYLLSLRGRLQREELDLISRRDALTGLGNRHWLDEVLNKYDAAPANDEQLSIVMLDIDRFKAYNDTLGHQAGDLCLRRVASIVQVQLREGSDCAFRFGGEVFVVVLRATDLRTAIGVAERMRLAIEELAIPHPAGSLKGIVTASFGVACAVSVSQRGTADLIARADSALYASKSGGRNRVSPGSLPTPVRARHAAVAR